MRFLLFLATFIPLAAVAVPVAVINPNEREIHVETSTAGEFTSLADLQDLIQQRDDLSTAVVLSGEAANGTRAIVLESEISASQFTIEVSDGNLLYSRTDATVGNVSTSGSRFGLIDDSITFARGRNPPN